MISLSYIKFSDVPFLNKKHKDLCEALLRDINKMETQCLYDEEFILFIKENVGEQAANVIASNSAISFKTLSALRIAFWYYTGYNPSRVIFSQGKDDMIDIFDPLGDSNS